MKISLGVGESKPVSIAGSQFYLLNSSEKVNVRIISGGDARAYDLSAGMGFKDLDGNRFGGVEIKNLGINAQDIEFEISDREVFDNRVTFGGGDGDLPVAVKDDACRALRVTTFTVDGATAGIAGKQALPPNPDRRSVSFFADHNCLLGGSGMDPVITSGIYNLWPIRAYEVITIKTKGHIYISSGLVGGIVKFLEEVN